MKKKGFTLIELLATITIVGIMSTIAIVAVNKVLGLSRNNYYKTLEKNIALATKTYAQNNRSLFPRNINGQKTITLKELVENNYIKDVVDHANQECNLAQSTITITKTGNNKYTYQVNLKCPNYKK